MNKLFNNIETKDLERIINSKKKDYVELHIPEEPHHFIEIKLTNYPDEAWPEKNYRILEIQEAQELAQKQLEEVEYEKNESERIY